LLAGLVAVLMGLANLALSWLLQQLMDTISGSSKALPLGTLALFAGALLAMIVLHWV
jgi:hypothetical protein